MNKNKKLKISADKVKRMKELCRKNDIGKLFVFGSRARGDFRYDSDLDLLVQFKKTKGLLDLVRLELKLMKIFGKKVEIITFGSIPSSLKSQIMKEAVPIL
ncbi:MAG: nucleotidyltransferase family protein [Elusimicrobia bacterium]|nr:nucleotidyltransferase family protein [Elusimicrobiota bacterium]